MKIVVNHLTRMQKGCMCVAGVALETGRHVRPRLRSQMRTRCLARYGGLFDIGCVVELGRVKFVGNPPQVEDREFKLPKAERLKDMPAQQFWQLLCETARGKLTAIFGNALQPKGRRSCGVDKGRGAASLGCLKVVGRPHLSIKQLHGRNRIRLELDDGDFNVDLPVTDIRLYGPDHQTPDPHIVTETARRLHDGLEAIASVGLGWPPPDSNVHWLQVNNIHFRHHPLWRLG